MSLLDLGAKPLPSLCAIASALATQALCSRLRRLSSIDLRSPLITGLSLSLLLRADEPWIHAAAGMIAILSKVVLAWDEGKTAITMASDYQGDPKEFAVVIPVPTFIERQQIDVVDMRMVDHLDAFTAPRLVEYFDPDPCALQERLRFSLFAGAPAQASRSDQIKREPGVTVEATYDVAEYDVSILSAAESDGLVAWLSDNGYRIPEGAEDMLQSYIKQKMHFFVAKVNLDRMALIGSGYLRPLQVRYESKKFMLPLRLGTVNASGPQDLIVLALTRKGRVETTNYPTVKLPTGMDVPLYVKDDFGKFYTAMFDRAVAREDMRAVFLEYAWDMGDAILAPQSRCRLPSS